jgi:hypothetical protein
MVSAGLMGMLEKLRFSGTGESLEIRLHEAASSGLNHGEFLELVLQVVRNSRQELSTGSFGESPKKSKKYQSAS